MTDGIEELTKLLTILLSAYQRLAELADKQRLALIKRDVPALRQIVSQMQETVSVVQRTEQEREELVTTLATEWQVPGALTLDSLVSYIDGPAYQRLHSIGQMLRTVILQLQHSNAGNHQLTQQSMAYIDNLFEMIAKHTTVQTYGPTTSTAADTYRHLALNIQG